MSIVDMHEVNFEWPYTNPKTVIVTGTFDQWSSTCHLTRSPSGFAGSINIPWNQKILYKFIVDGHWVLRYDRPTETEGRTGYVNHVYIAPPKPVLSLDSESPEPVIADAGKHKGHVKEGVKGRSGAISNGIIAEAPERRVQPIAVPSPDKFDRPGGGGETVPNMSAPPTDSDAVAVPPPPAKDSQKESPLAPIVPIMIVPVNARENITVVAAPLVVPEVTPPTADVLPKASEEPAKDVAVKVDHPSTHSPIVAVSEVMSTPDVEEKAEPKPAEVPKPVTEGAKVEEPKAVTAVEDKHTETYKKEESASTSSGVESAEPSPEKTKDIPKRTPPATPNKAHVFPTSGSPPPSPSSSRFSSTKRCAKKRTSSIFGRIKKIFKSDKEKAKDKTK